MTTTSIIYIIDEDNVIETWQLTYTFQNFRFKSTVYEMEGN